ncbi:OLC1v1003396C1 [Oldenlandia corymbosa var. corymbosa]|uniref:OLC1v1003396C1 n=1 Tax=Oldenlandia corymbosa var. corymbosa TaxID=529605 RepID=A0AAV1DAR4_OLDCO|nr:OLC1v1003396C1 [Oldenlandia corymbosa var. corymbosa]
MGIRSLASSMVLHAKHLFRARANIHDLSGSSIKTDVSRGHLAVYVGDDDTLQSCNNKNNHRFVVPISYLKHPLFQDLLRRAEEEHGFAHPMGGLTIPCSKTAFLDMSSQFNEAL